MIEIKNNDFELSLVVVTETENLPYSPYDFWLDMCLEIKGKNINLFIEWGCYKYNFSKLIEDLKHLKNDKNINGMVIFSPEEKQFNLTFKKKNNLYILKMLIYMELRGELMIQNTLIIDNPSLDKLINDINYYIVN